MLSELLVEILQAFAERRFLVGCRSQLVSLLKVAAGVFVFPGGFMQSVNRIPRVGQVLPDVLQFLKQFLLPGDDVIRTLRGRVFVDAQIADF